MSIGRALRAIIGGFVGGCRSLWCERFGHRFANTGTRRDVALLSMGIRKCARCGIELVTVGRYRYTREPAREDRPS